MASRLFLSGLFILYAYLILIVWSLARPQQRIWPPPKTPSWQFFIFWGLFYLGVGFSVVVMALDWNQWRIPQEIRWWVGVPLCVLGGGLLVWGIRTLGLANTQGKAAGFVRTGPYRFTRNPQYLGDIVMLFGVLLLANSLFTTVLLGLLILSFILLPLPEEIWLEGRYGEPYLQYQSQTPRFL